MHALANAASKNTAVTVNGAADDDGAVGDVNVSGLFNPAVAAQMNKFIYGLTEPKILWHRSLRIFALLYRFRVQA